jgi:hypothetical protein
MVDMGPQPLRALQHGTRDKTCNISGIVTRCILDVDDLEGALVVLLVNNCADTTVVSTSSDHAQVAHAKLHEVLDLASLDIQHDGVVSLRPQNQPPKSTQLKKILFLLWRVTSNARDFEASWVSSNCGEIWKQ